MAPNASSEVAEVAMVPVSLQDDSELIKPANLLNNKLAALPTSFSPSVSKKGDMVEVEIVPSSTTAVATTSSEEALDVNFNARIWPSLGKRVFDRTWVVLAQLAQLGYLMWRWQRFLTVPSDWGFSIPFIIAETLIVACGAFITYFLVWNQCTRPDLRLNALRMDPKDYPTVDIMIPCYNEPVDIVRRTTLACLAMDYPAEKITICICDDGKSSAMRALVAQITAEYKGKARVRYIARTKLPGIPHHAKAGNINNALMNEGTSGDYIVIFDCDMECKPQFLQAVLPHFLKVDQEQQRYVVDEQVSMVQTPQSFTNVPEDDPLGQGYRYFYGPVLRGWDSVGCTPCCGTNVVFSRKCLLSVGGFTYGSITEDFLTSMTLHAAGFESKYVHEYLAAGLAPESLHGFYKQRFRWAAGGLEIFVRNNALFKKGLTGVQRFLYFWAGFNTVLSLAMLFLIHCPLIYLLCQGIFQIATFDSAEYFMAFMPYMCFQIVCMNISYQGCPKGYISKSLRESVFMLYCYARAVLTVFFGLKLGFKVTSKDGESSEFRKSFNWLIPFLVYYFLGSVSLAFGVLQMIKAYFESGHNPSAIIAVSVSLFWITFIMWQMWPPIAYVIRGLTEEERMDKAKVQEDRA